MSKVLNARQWFQILKDTVKAWQDDDAPRHGAALAFYSILSLGPLLLIVISVAGLVLGQEAASGLVLSEMRGLVGETGARAIQDVIANSQNEQKSLIATAIGTTALIVSVSGFFSQLQGALNQIFNVPKSKMDLGAFVLKRILSFSMIICICLLLLVSLAVSSILAAVTSVFAGSAPALILSSINLAISLAVTTLLFAMTFKVLPDVKFAWRNVWIGAGITALLFTIGKSLIGLYLGHSALGSTYGAAGSLIVLLVWIYYSTQIIFFGAEFTQVYGQAMGETFELEGERIEPIPAAPANQTVGELVVAIAVTTTLAFVEHRRQVRAKGTTATDTQRNI